MKIIAFQIRNYRSIIDSKKCFLSPDYITSLIGQNESGKTSVLEALRSFYEGVISDDILRSDLTFPEITCTFKLDEGKFLADYADLSRLPADLQPLLAERSEVVIRRKWLNAQQNVISTAEEEILEYYRNLEKIRSEDALKITSSLPILVKEADNAGREREGLERSINTIRDQIRIHKGQADELNRIISRSKIPDNDKPAELENLRQQILRYESELKQKADDLEEFRKNEITILQKLTACKSFNDLVISIKVLNDEIKANLQSLHETENQFRFTKSEKEARNLGKRLEQIRERQSRLKEELNRSNLLLCRKRKIAVKLLDGINLAQAEAEATRECDTESSYISPEEMGIHLFKHIPVFEFFEDFSSLLPNKIDLDDLLNENIHAEGYKAARNFLAIAGLNADFFREDNHRILKQKIENLNSEITINFQDYWRQSVGKDDKIRINFELEHYDNSQPDKSGKPYLEFWIKDKQERLYPKQRSRGVRWFLSFYLELKATAKENSIDRVMLIDEPGLSLHARAQEDVLKVFEDLRENLQIIYCTHSPNLIDLNKLYRIIAVQRAKESDEKSESIVLDSRRLNEASTDTLSPVYALMGTRLNDKQFIFPKNNFIVEDTVTFHYLEAMSRLFGFDKPVHFIPASDAGHVPDMANLFVGWKVDFGVILTDNEVSRRLLTVLENTTFCHRQNGDAKNLITISGSEAIEDLFSTIDFKRFVLKQRVGITIKNSEHIVNNKLSRMILASEFLTRLSAENIQFSDFDDETRKNFENLFSRINLALGKE